MTVIVALSGLFLIDAKVVRSMAVGAIVVVAIAVLAAVTLLPALIGALGKRVIEPGKIIGRLRRKREPKPGPGFWERWTQTLMKRPLPFALGATALMLLIAAPALSLKEGTAAIAMFPEDFETRVGFELAAQELGPGATGPVQVLVDVGRAPVDQDALRALHRDRARRCRAWRRSPARSPPAAATRSLTVVADRHARERGHGRAGRAPALHARPGRRDASASAAPPPRTRTTPRSSPARCGRSGCSSSC